VRAITRRLLNLVQILIGLKRTTLPTPVFGALLIITGGGPLLFQSASVSSQFLRAGYDPIRQAISALVYGPYGWLQTMAFYAFGISLITLAITLFFHIDLNRHIKTGIFILVLLGGAFAVVGGNPTLIQGAERTVSTTIHQIAAIFIVFMFPVACFLLAPSLKAMGHTLLHRYTIAAGIFAVVFLTVGGIILVLKFHMVGLYERVLLVNGQIWVEVVCGQIIYDIIRKRQTTRKPA
jgi:hypothetical protein